MKFKIASFLLILLIYGCAGPKTSIKQKRNTINMDQININELLKIESGEKPLSKNQRFSSQGSEYSLTEISGEKMTRIEVIKKNDEIDHVLKIITSGDTIIRSEYYPNGFLKEKYSTLTTPIDQRKEKSISFHNIRFDRSYQFDSLGNLLKQINYDEEYLFSLNNLIKYLGQKFPNKEASITQTNYSKTDHLVGMKKPIITNYPYWEVTIVIPTVNNMYKWDIYTIDGKTGDLVMENHTRFKHH